MRQNGIVTIHEADQGEYDRVEELMATYADAPMDIADAAIISAAERLNLSRVFTLDRHFYSYILPNGHPMQILGLELP